MADQLGFSSTCDDVVKAFPDGASAVEGSTVIVTGSSGGIGEETAYQFAKLGGKVILACRSTNKAQDAIKRMEKRAKGDEKLDLAYMTLDLSDLTSVRAFAEEFLSHAASEMWQLRYIVCNAGVFPTQHLETKQGFEAAFGTNHLGHFALVNLLLPELRAHAPSRVLMVSSYAHTFPVTLSKATLESVPDATAELAFPKFKTFGTLASNSVYSNSKLCNVLFAKQLARRELDNGVSACALHPGTIPTDIMRSWAFLGFVYKFIKPFVKNVDTGTSTTIFCALSPSYDITGKYFDSCKEGKMSKKVTEKAQQALWELSVALTQTD